MERTLGTTEAGRRLAELVDLVREQGDTITLLKSGEPAAVLVPIELYERWKTGRLGALDAIRRLQAAHVEDLPEDEALALAIEAQQAIRTQA